MTTQPTWGIVATLDEPLSLVAAFVAHHLSLGCAHIWLFLDAPLPEAEALLAQEPRVTVTQTDDAYWQERGGRPPVHVRRQLVNAQNAYAEATSGAHRVDWIIHCDGDEFLHFDRGAFLAEIGAAPRSVLGMRILNSERVWIEGEPRDTIFAGHSRVPFRRRRGGLIDIYGEQTMFLRQGVLGFANGKCLARTGRGLFLGIHQPKLMGSDGWADHKSTVLTWDCHSAGLVHFDGLTPLHWIVKLLRKAKDQTNPEILRDRVGDARMAQVEFIQNADGDPELTRALHDSLRILPEDLVSNLRDLCQLAPMPVDIAGAVTEAFPNADIDLSEAAFDDWVAARMPGLSAPFRS